MIQAILRKCKKCGRYTLRKDRCPYCGGEVENPHPPKYSPDDRYYIYRMCMKILSGALPVPDDIKQKVIEKFFLKQSTEKQATEEKVEVTTDSTTSS